MSDFGTVDFDCTRKKAVADPGLLHVVADAGYGNGEQAEACAARGILPHVPAHRAIHHQGDTTLFGRTLAAEMLSSPHRLPLCGLRGESKSGIPAKTGTPLRLLASLQSRFRNRLGAGRAFVRGISSPANPLSR